MSSEYRQLILQAEYKPLRVEVQCDGSPMLLYTTKHVPNGLSHAVSKGRICREFFYMRSLASFVDLTGEIMVANLVAEAKHCTRKFAWMQFGSLVKFLPLARSLGHVGLLVYGYPLDGGLYSAMSRRCAQRHDLWYEQYPTSKNYKLLKAREWVLFMLWRTRCCKWLEMGNIFCSFKHYC
jgi:hypothetical protein